MTFLLGYGLLSLTVAVGAFIVAAASQFEPSDAAATFWVALMFWPVLALMLTMQGVHWALCASAGRISAIGVPRDQHSADEAQISHNSDITDEQPGQLS